MAPVFSEPLVSAMNSLGLVESRRERMVDVLSKRTTRLTLVFDRISDAHNVHAVLRTADLFGVEHVHVIQGETTKARVCSNARRFQSDMGVARWMRIESHKSVDEALDALAAADYHVLVSALHARSTSLHECLAATLEHPPRRPTTSKEEEEEEEGGEKRVALVFGNEHSGVCDELLDVADGVFKLEMRGFAESFNLSVAAAVSLAEVRHFRPYDFFAPNLTLTERDRLVTRWLSFEHRSSRHVLEGLGLLPPNR